MSILKYIPGGETAKKLGGRAINSVVDKGKEILGGLRNKTIEGIQNTTKSAIKGIFKGLSHLPIFSFWRK
ncbi:MAG: hypothetical protein WC101_05625 [Candidatus Gracilibacteria bacterium]